MLALHRAIKAVFDRVAAALALLLLSPLFAVIALQIKFDSKGPVFFRQERRTKDGRIFTMVKFRTMVQGAEEMGAGLFNYKDDPRVTRVGRFLRRTSLDELPQLLCVLRGDLSLVGPRPCVAYELGDFDTLNSRYKKRFSVKAGITGLAQVNGRNALTWDEKVAYDNLYIDRFAREGVWLDLRILARTAAQLFRREEIFETKPDGSISDADAARAAEEEVIRAAHAPEVCPSRPPSSN